MRSRRCAVVEPRRFPSSGGRIRGYALSRGGGPGSLSGLRAFLNLRVADINKVYQEWSARGAKFLTEPKDHGREIRAYIRDPDGHLIEVGQTTRPM